MFFFLLDYIHVCRCMHIIYFYARLSTTALTIKEKAKKDGRRKPIYFLVFSPSAFEAISVCLSKVLQYL